jgi:quercetin dioxygenase-like cupin family protein
MIEDAATAVNIAERIEVLLHSLRQPAIAQDVAPFLEDWPQAYLPRAVTPSHLPVLSWLPEIGRDRAAFGIDLVTAVCRAAQSMAWRQTYSTQDADAAFLDNYGWSEILGASGPLGAERIACGFLILGPSTHYPRHRHEAEELYVPLSGTAGWQQGDAPWREQSPGTAIHHARDEPHAMRTGAQALLALYLWRSADLKQKARLDAAAG